MILGFLLIGITLGYWTVKSATSIPVQESNTFMMKYQQADMHINDILKQKAAFDRRYTIVLTGAEMQLTAIAHSKVAKRERSVLLKRGENSFRYHIETKAGETVSDANVTFLLTRPHTDREDFAVRKVPLVGETYLVQGVRVDKPGRYTLQLKVKIGDAIGYASSPAYLVP